MAICHASPMYYAATFLLFFIPPKGLRPEWNSIYYGIFYTLFYIGDTVANVP